MNLLIKKLTRAFTLTTDLIESLDEAHLQLALPDLPSNKIGAQIWCMVGARESHLNAIKNEKWMGFACSLKAVESKVAVLAALDASQQALTEFLAAATTLTEIQADYAFNLLEHEIQHHGQLIRYIYGNKLAFPHSWHERYTV